MQKCPNPRRRVPRWCEERAGVIAGIPATRGFLDTRMSYSETHPWYPHITPTIAKHVLAWPRGHNLMWQVVILAYSILGLFFHHIRSLRCFLTPDLSDFSLYKGLRDARPNQLSKFSGHDSTENVDERGVLVGCWPWGASVCSCQLLIFLVKWLINMYLKYLQNISKQASQPFS